MNFNVIAMNPYVDFFNFMAYNLHSPLDSTGLMWPATNITDIDLALDSLWRAGLTPSKINLGTAYYGHVYQASSTSCLGPGCASAGAGTQGTCSQNAGTLYNSEVGAYIKATNPKITLNTSKWSSLPSHGFLIRHSSIREADRRCCSCRDQIFHLQEQPGGFLR